MWLFWEPWRDHLAAPLQCPGLRKPGLGCARGLFPPRNSAAVRETGNSPEPLGAGWGAPGGRTLSSGTCPGPETTSSEPVLTQGRPQRSSG